MTLFRMSCALSRLSAGNADGFRLRLVWFRLFHPYRFILIYF